VKFKFLQTPIAIVISDNRGRGGNGCRFSSASATGGGRRLPRDQGGDRDQQGKDRNHKRDFFYFFHLILLAKRRSTNGLGFSLGWGGSRGTGRGTMACLVTGP